MKKTFVSDFGIILILFVLLMLSLGWISYDFYEKYQEHQKQATQQVISEPPVESPYIPPQE